MMCLTPLSLFSMKIFLVIRPLIKSLITFKTIFCVAKACLFKSCNIKDDMVLYGNELPTSTAPIHKHSENKKRSSKSKKLKHDRKNFNFWFDRYKSNHTCMYNKHLINFVHICRYLNKNWIKIIEAGLVAVVSAAVAFGLMVGINECTDKAPFDSHAVTASVSLVSYGYLLVICPLRRPVIKHLPDL